MRAEAITHLQVTRRVDSPSSNAWFAVLAGIGAFWLAQGVLVGAASVLLWMAVFHRESGPPRFEPTLLPTAFAGAFVAVRLGGWRGFLGVLAFASIPFTRALMYPIGSAIECSHGNIDACRGATDLDFVLPQVWLLPGFAMGVLAAVLTRARVPLQVELEALAPIALVQFVSNYLLPLMQGYPNPAAFDIVMTVVGLLAAGYILARRSSNRWRSALIVGGVLLLLDVPWVLYLLWFNRDRDLTLWSRWLSLASPVVLVIATRALSLATRRTGNPSDVTPSS
jgi:hypothetical protein